MSSTPAVLAVDLPEEAFVEEDGPCIAAGMKLSKQLSAHLRASGHVIPDWLKDGCAEDAWVHLESIEGHNHYVYSIVFFQHDDHYNAMAIQYSRKVSLLQRIFKKPDGVEAGDQLHQVMRDFGRTFQYSKMLSRAEFDALY